MSDGPSTRSDAGPPGEARGHSQQISVCIVEDHKDILEGLAHLIESTASYRLAGAWGSMEQALPRLTADPPDVALVDIGLPGMSGIEGIRILKQRRPEMVAIVLTIYDDDERIFEALCAGASGYLLKKTLPQRLLESLREAVEGGSPISPEIARRVINIFREFRPPKKAEHDLTPHETRLLRLLVEGHNYRSAAAEVGCSPHTINFHMKSVYLKLQVHSKSEAVAKALRQRILD